MIKSEMMSSQISLLIYQQYVQLENRKSVWSLKSCEKTRLNIKKQTLTLHIQS